MAIGNHRGRARLSRSNPEAMGECDRCGTWYSRRDLQFQHQWAGPTLLNTRYLVCKRCTDRPQEQFRTIILPPDPYPVVNPRPPGYAPAPLPLIYAIPTGTAVDQFGNITLTYTPYTDGVYVILKTDGTPLRDAAGNLVTDYTSGRSLIGRVLDSLGQPVLDSDGQIVRDSFGFDVLFIVTNGNIVLDSQGSMVTDTLGGYVRDSGPPNSVTVVIGAVGTNGP